MQSKSSIWMLVLSVLALLNVSCSERGGGDVHGLEQARESIFSSSACKLESSEVLDLKIGELLREPERFEGKVVTFSGYYYRSFEQSVIYEGRSSTGDQGGGEALWVEGLSPFSGLNGKHLQVMGVFSVKEKGHLAQWPGSVCVISGTGVQVLRQ